MVTDLKEDMEQARSTNHRLQQEVRTCVLWCVEVLYAYMYVCRLHIDDIVLDCVFADWVSAEKRLDGGCKVSQDIQR